MLFVYTARDNAGTFIRGALNATSIQDAISTLRLRPVFITSLVEAGSRTGLALSLLHIRISMRRDLSELFHGLAALVSAGVDLNKSIDICLSVTKNAFLRESLKALMSDLESGAALSAAMARRPRDFSTLAVCTVRAGETGGELDKAFALLAEMYDKQIALARKIHGSLLYPGLISVGALAVITFLLTTVLPAFAAMYSEFHAALPRAIQVALSLSNAVRGPTFLVITGCAIFAAATVARALMRKPHVIATIDVTLLNTPILGSLLRKLYSARIARLLSTLLKAGVNISSALDLVQEALWSPTYLKIVRALRTAISTGATMSSVLESSKHFDSFFVQIVRVGEESGSPDSAFARIANHEEAAFESALTALCTLIEPILMIGLGMVVAAIVGTVLIPLYSLIGNIR